MEIIPSIKLSGRAEPPLSTLEILYCFIGQNGLTSANFGAISIFRISGKPQNSETTSTETGKVSTGVNKWQFKARLAVNSSAEKEINGAPPGGQTLQLKQKNYEYPGKMLTDAVTGYGEVVSIAILRVVRAASQLADYDAWHESRMQSADLI